MRRSWIGSTGSRLALIALVTVAAVACSSSDSGSTSSTPPASVTVSGAAADGCAEVAALKDSLTALTQVNIGTDGLAALDAAVATVKSNLQAAASAVSADLKPSVDQVQTAVDQLETALQGVTSSNLAASATAIGTALAGVGTALTSLSSELSQKCPGT